ncbi:MAG: diguanylate cyclase, partial [Proteobacteria bacterium]
MDTSRNAWSMIRNLFGITRKQSGGGDPLTGLPVRSAFLQRLSQARRAGESALIVVDIAGYHQITLTYGEYTGDRVLQFVGESLVAMCRGNDYAARVGDDQFALLLSGVLSEEHVLLATHRVASLFEAPLTFDGLRILVRVNMGVCLSTTVKGAGIDQFEGAMKAMYLAKRSSESAVFYQPGETREEGDESPLLSRFKQAIENSELELVFQAKQDVQRSAVCGAEALIRWRNAELGEINPRRIVSLAKRTGDLDRLT